MFSYPIKWGNKQALKDPSKIIISEEISIKYFGDTNPVGEQIVMNFGEDKLRTFIIGAVAERFPPIYSFDFPMLVNWENKKGLFEEDEDTDWKNFIEATFIQLENSEDIGIIDGGMHKYVELQNKVDFNWPAVSYPTHSLSNLSLNAHTFNGIISNGDEPTGRIILSIMAGFLLTLACFNYMNIAIVSATKRIKEIGIRKTIGSSKFQLVRQFLIENVLLTVLALILGTLFAVFVILPWFKVQFGLGLELNVFGNPRVWLFYLGMLILVGFASGSYPAFYITSFKPADIFRGGFKISAKNKFTKVFLTFQFVLSLIAIVSGIIFVQNVKYQRDKDWGYDNENIYVVKVPEARHYKALRNRALQNPDIISVAGSGQLVGRSWRAAIVHKNDEQTQVYRIDVGADYIETLDLHLLEGRTFNSELKTDQQTVIVNELFAERLGWDQIIDNTFYLDSVEYHIIGMVEDFHFASFWMHLEPLMLRMVPEEDYGYLSAKLKPGSALRSSEFFEKEWKEVEPDLPYDGFFQDTVFDNYFNNAMGHSRLIGATAIMAIILSCMGLFGLVSLNVASRMKEFSIRKVLGAGPLAMAKRVNKQYIWLLVIASMIGAPASYFLMVALLDSIYKYHVPVQVPTILLGTVAIFVVAFLTVSSLVAKVIRANPVNSLRNE
jgi:hypothetical protein